MNWNRCYFLVISLSLFVTTPGLAQSAENSGFWQILNDLSAEQMKEVASGHIWLALLLCFFGGILTSLTPCVYPMIPITINIFGRAAQSHAAATKTSGFNWPAFAVALIYVAGMCLTYSLMGLVAGLTGSLFGRILQSSYVLFTLTLLFLLFGLGQLGLFKMTLPAPMVNRLSSIGATDSRSGIFFVGAISGLLISPCVGPVIAGILAFVFETSNALLGLLYFFFFSLGLGVLFLVLGGFSGLLSRIPRSGPWMLIVNKALACLLLIAAAYYGLLWLKQIGWVKRSFSPSSVSGIQWNSDEKIAQSIARKKKLPVIIDFTAEWCEACHEIEETVFQDPRVIEYIGDNFVALRFDVTDDSSPNNEKILKKFRVVGLPMIAFINQNGKIIEDTQINGVISVKEFLEITRSIKAQ